MSPDAMNAENAENGVNADSAARRKVMLVTGASRGIGAAIARAAGRAGYRVGVNYLHSEAAAHAVVADIRQSGGEAVALHTDVSRSEDVQRMFVELDAAFGALDALVNNAGVLGVFRVDALDEAQLDAVFRSQKCEQKIQRCSESLSGQSIGCLSYTLCSACLVLPWYNLFVLIFYHRYVYS